MTGQRRGGFTLLEVLVAILLLALSLAAVTQSYRTSLGAVGRSDEIARATIDARSLLAAAEAGALRAAGGTLADGSRWRRHERRRADLVPAGAAIIPIERTIDVETTGGRRVAVRALDWVAVSAG